jgi:AmmeMemoRadiSam system protein A
MMADIYLPVDSQRRLIRIARYTLEDCVRGNRNRRPENGDPYLETAKYGAFVTLYKEDELRGCIGTCAPSGPLGHMVMEMTEAAASRDRRVAPILAGELAQVNIDISVLSPLEQAADPLSLTVGVHGLHVARNGKRGVLLPQVAAERLWDMETFLEQTCVKAKLPKTAWRWPDTDVCSFKALIIEEEA